MHRVELKVQSTAAENGKVFLFLMHRVELKAGKGTKLGQILSRVPNAPCGVESKSSAKLHLLQIETVPNAPCGVESHDWLPLGGAISSIRS